MKVRRMDHVRPYGDTRRGRTPRKSGKAEQKLLRTISHVQIVVHSNEVAVESTCKRAHRDICPNDLFLVGHGN